MDDASNLSPPASVAAIWTETQAIGFAMASEPLTGSLLRTLAASRQDGTVQIRVTTNLSKCIELERALEERWGLARAIVIPEPQDAAQTSAILGAELGAKFRSVLERILLIAAHKRVPVHHVTVQNLGENLSISLDVEVDARMSLGAAHAIASRLESAIRHEFGGKTEVETHIEPLTVALLEGADASPALHDTITTHLKQEAPSAITDIHNVRVRENIQGLIVNYHCRVNPDLSVSDIHTLVDRLEQKTKSAFPQIARIVSHTEPLRSSPQAQ